MTGVTHDHAAIQAILGLTEALAAQLNPDWLAVDLEHIRWRHIDQGQDDAARVLKLLVMAVMIGRSP